MRISSQMQSASLTNMHRSAAYKSFIKKEKDEDEKKLSSPKDKDTKAISKDVIVEKKDDAYVLSRVGKDKGKSSIIANVKEESKLGLELKKYFDNEPKTETQEKLSQVNTAIKSMSLSNYL